VLPARQATHGHGLQYYFFSTTHLHGVELHLAQTSAFLAESAHFFPLQPHGLKHEQPEKLNAQTAITASTTSFFILISPVYLFMTQLRPLLNPSMLAQNPASVANNRTHAVNVGP
jgi:hypothetical protein